MRPGGKVMDDEFTLREERSKVSSIFLWKIGLDRAWVSVSPIES